jgi:hypothetical protein
MAARAAAEKPAAEVGWAGWAVEAWAPVWPAVRQLALAWAPASQPTTSTITTSKNNTRQQPNPVALPDRLSANLDRAAREG